MRRSLASRLWIAFSLCTLVVLGVTGILRVAAEREVVARTMVRDRRFFGESWLVLLAHAPAGELDQMVSALARDPIVEAQHIHVSVDSREAAHDRARAMPVHQRERLERGRVAAAVVGDRLRTLIPVARVGDDLLIELDEPLDVGGHLAMVHRASVLASSAALLIVSAIVLWVLVRRLVARPLEALGAHARAVGSGELDMRLDLPDTTELGALADEMNAMTDQLAAAHAALARLDADRSQLQESLRHADRLRTAGQLSAALAHELGTPLNVVIGRAQLLERDEGASASGRQGASVIVSEAKRIADLVRRLLGFVRRSEHEAERVEAVGATLARAIDLLMPMARRRAIALALEAEDATELRVLKPDELVQIVTNLVVNAIQACPDGVGVEVHARRSPGGRDGSRIGVALEVVDHGPGIDAAILPHLFEPFFTTKPGDQGTGLGLSVVRGIVDERGGTLEHDVTPGGGATFRVWLPAML
ncbi:MAG: HAMP domain-containing histidine kinase [Sandaracinaceae bacterium]|nr:HAMP domain-containing histidine kinase [Sandaracinaceae bacterium]